MRGRAVALVLVLALPLLGGCAASTTAPPPAAAVGRVVLRDFNKGIVVVDFSGRQMFVNMDLREMNAYLPGDEIRIDAAGRPLPRL